MVKHRAIKRKISKPYPEDNIRIWERESDKPNTLCAFYVGVRTVYNGTLFYEDFGEFTTTHFIGTDSRTVWLFVLSDRENIFYAFPEDVQTLGVEAITNYNLNSRQ
jgi:hypothetical protein